eukprot:g10251.t1
MRRRKRKGVGLEANEDLRKEPPAHPCPWIVRSKRWLAPLCAACLSAIDTPTASAYTLTVMQERGGEEGSDANYDLHDRVGNSLRRPLDRDADGDLAGLSAVVKPEDDPSRIAFDAMDVDADPTFLYRRNANHDSGAAGRNANHDSGAAGRNANHDSGAAGRNANHHSGAAGRNGNHYGGAPGRNANDGSAVEMEIPTNTSAEAVINDAGMIQAVKESFAGYLESEMGGEPVDPNLVDEVDISVPLDFTWWCLF